MNQLILNQTTQYSLKETTNWYWINKKSNINSFISSHLRKRLKL